MNLTMRPARPEDTKVVCEILHEAARWLQETGRPMWRTGELLEERLAREIDLFFLAEVDGQVVGTLKIEVEDPVFWPDHPEPAAAYLHRLAIRRTAAGRGFPQAMLIWAVSQVRMMGKSLLRLDCEASRPRLRALYETFGFVFHSEKQIGPYLVARYEYSIPPL